MVTFYVVRHGQTLLNYLRRTQGWVDSPLTNAGIQAALDLGNKLREVDFHAIYASDMSRATQTAELILSASGKSKMPIQKDARLREWCLGNMETEDVTVFFNNVADWIGGVSSFEELNKHLPDVAAAIHEHDTTGMTEPFSDIANRLENIFTEISQENYEKDNSYNVLIVTHAFAIKTLFYLFAPEQLDTIGKIKNTGISQLKFDGIDFSLEADVLL